MKRIVKILLFTCFLSLNLHAQTVDDIELVFELTDDLGSNSATATITAMEDTVISFSYTSLDSNKSFFVRVGTEKVELNGTGMHSMPVLAGESIRFKMEGGLNNGKIFNFKPNFHGQFEPNLWELSPVQFPIVRFVNLPLGTNGFCPYSVARNNFEWIDQVTIGDEVNKSGKDNNGHGVFRSMPLNFNFMDTVKLELQPGYNNRVYTEYWRVWIDFNQDNDFMDEGELVFQKAGKDLVTGDFVIPDLEVFGNYEMRVAMGWKRYPPACGSYISGEFEQYVITIFPNP